jgi:uncharacterized protein (DUF1800 family)
VERICMATVGFKSSRLSTLRFALIGFTRVLISPARFAPTGLATLSLTALLLSGCAGFHTTNGSDGSQEATLIVSPAKIAVRGAGSQIFTAKAKDGTSPNVTWSVNGVIGGSAAIGTISAAGVYTAPTFPPTPNTVTVGAAESSDPFISGTAALSLNNPTPQLMSLSQTSIPVGAFKIVLNGANFAPGASVMFGSTTLTAARISATQLNATGTATNDQVGTVAVVVQNPSPGVAASAALNAQVITPNDAGVAVSPATAAVRVGGTQIFTATVSGGSNNKVTWSVNGVVGGNGTNGTIDSSGTYHAPANLPTPNTISVSAVSTVDTTKKGNSAVTVENPLPVVTAVNPTKIAPGNFMLTVTGAGFVSTSQVNFGGQILNTLYVSPTELEATGVATSGQAGNVPVMVQNPDPGAANSGTLSAQVVSGSPVVTSAAAERFIEQSTFGPTPQLTTQVQQLGFDSFLQNQFSAPISPYPTPAASDSGLENVQNQFFINAVNGPDQLRQRVAFALNEVFVVSENKVSDPTGYTLYMRALENDALGNYYDVMKDVTLTAAMGHFLDMVNNDKPAAGQHANENYARECMQLFTLGLNQLNPDGTPVLDGSGNPIPTYTQNDVMALGRSYTGWTYPTMPGQAMQKNNPSYYGGPMVAYESNHDSGAKTFLGASVAAGQSAEQELATVLGIIFNHTNLPPFVATQLIEKLVTSNPSPAYVARVATAFSSGTFQSYGSGKRGDLQATVAAILLDPEARRGDSPTTAVPGDGKLREPIVMMVSVARAFSASTDGNGFTGWGAGMSQNLFNSPSVFNFFPPVNPVAGTSVNGPEFAIYNTNTSGVRLNFINAMVFSQISSNTKLDFTPVINAGTPDQMADLLNSQLLHGTMSSSMKQDIVTATNAVSSSDSKDRARAEIYLVLSSSQYQVQR